VAQVPSEEREHLDPAALGSDMIVHGEVRLHPAVRGGVGLARRIGPNAYATAEYDGPPRQFKRRGKRSQLRRELRPLLSMRSTLIGLRCKTGAPIDEIREVLREMWLSGSIVGNEEAGYILKDSGL
jgi:hypothetical protein